MRLTFSLYFILGYCFGFFNLHQASTTLDILTAKYAKAKLR